MRSASQVSRISAPESASKVNYCKASVLFSSVAVLDSRVGSFPLIAAAYVLSARKQ
jgi:hypothetical protein